jgi:hypothetical protein
MRLSSLVPTALALVALFVALDGPAWAARLINGQEIRLRSIKGNRIARDALTGIEINEQTLGKVRSATRADRANTAGTAGAASRAETARLAEQASFAFRADAATNADSAGRADRADAAVFAFAAGNADRLGSLGAGAFERARIDVGRAAEGSGDVVIAYPPAGAEIRTGAGNALVLRNTRSAGGADIDYSGGTVAPGDEEAIAPRTNPQFLLVSDTADRGRWWQVRCDDLAGAVHCVGIRSQPSG